MRINCKTVKVGTERFDAPNGAEIRQEGDELVVDSVQGLIERRPTKSEKENEIRLAIVEHIFGVKKEAAEARKSAAERKAAKDRLKGILAEKLDSADREKSIDDLKKMIEELG